MNRNFPSLLAILVLLSVIYELSRELAQSRGSESAARAAMIRLSDRLTQSQERLHTLEVDSGHVWDGQLHEPIQLSVDGANPHSATPELTSQRRIFGVVPLNADATLTARLELHECQPGSQFCTSGGAMALLDASGQTLCSTSLSLMAETGNRYELRWSDMSDSVSDLRKVRLLQQMVPQAESLSSADYRRLLNALYEAAATSPQPESYQRQLRTLVLAILDKMLSDRLAWRGL